MNHHLLMAILIVAAVFCIVGGAGMTWHATRLLNEMDRSPWHKDDVRFVDELERQALGVALIVIGAVMAFMWWLLL